MKPDQQLVWAIVLFLLGFFSGVASNLQNISQITEIVLISIATISAAFGGSWFAFRLHSDKSEEDNRSKNIVSSRLSQLTLLRQFSEVLYIKNTFFDPVRNSPQRSIKVKGSYGIIVDNTINDIRHIDFFLLSKHRNLLHKIIQNDQVFNKFVHMFNERSKFHGEIVLPKLAELKFDAWDSVTESDLNELLGIHITGQIISATEICYEMVDEFLMESKKLQKELYLACIDYFPGEEFVKPY